MIKMLLLIVGSLSLTSLPSFAKNESLTPAHLWLKQVKSKLESGYDVNTFWKNTGLTVNVIAREVAPHCYDNATTLQACTDALNVFSMNLVEPEYVATDADKERMSELGDVARDLGGGLKSYHLRKQAVTVKSILAKSARVQVEEMKKERDAHTKAIQDLYARSDLRVDFLDLILLYRARALVGEQRENEALFAATFFNAFVGVAMDPHTYIMTVEELEARSKVTEETQVRFGIDYRLVENGFEIRKILEGSPAISSGLQFGDIITAVDGKSVVGLIEGTETAKLSGPEGSQVTLEVLRGKEKKQFTLVRKKFSTPTFESKVVSDFGAPYGYIRFDNFLEKDGVARIKAAIEGLVAQGVKGFILDLRNNGGGEIKQAISISSFFVGRKVVLGFYDFAKRFKSYEFGDYDSLTDLPMVTIINGNSASASEIVSGALQSHGRSWILGDRSFGKGTVQSSGDQPFDERGKIAFLRTVGRFYQPSGLTNQLQGIIPDFYVDPFPGANEDDKFAMREEDQYKNAVAQDGAAWKQTRPEEVEKVNRCRSRRGKADRYYKKMSVNVVNAPDYRVLVAQDVLNCERAK